MKFTVEGMSCGHCVRAISGAVEKLGGTAQVDLQAGAVEVEGPVSPADVRRAIEAEGYRVTGECGV